MSWIDDQIAAWHAYLDANSNRMKQIPPSIQVGKILEQKKDIDLAIKFVLFNIREEDMLSVKKDGYWDLVYSILMKYKLSQILENNDENYSD